MVGVDVDTIAAGSLSRRSVGSNRRGHDADKFYERAAGAAAIGADEYSLWCGRSARDVQPDRARETRRTRRSVKLLP